MPDPVRIDVTVPDEVVGSTQYTVAITLTNSGTAEVDSVQVQPQVLFGSVVAREIDVRDAEEDELQARRRALIDEMQKQVFVAYESQAYRRMPYSQRLAMIVTEVVTVYVSLFTRRPQLRLAPSWTSQAFTINDWNDVEALEIEVISGEPAESDIRKAFLLDKNKLQRCLVELEHRTNKPAQLDFGSTLSPGSSITFPFTVKALHTFRRKVADLQFRVTFRDSQAGRLTSQSLTKRVEVFPSPFAVPTGGVLGAVCGRAIRLALDSPPAASASVILPVSWFAFVASGLLGLLIALLTMRKPDTYKIITVEDFIGGFIIGALTGLFSEAVLDRLRVLFAGASAG